MTEAFPRPTDTISSQLPLSPELVEITPQDIVNASPDELYTAVTAFRELHQSLTDSQSSLERQVAARKVGQANTTAGQIRMWNGSNQARAKKGIAAETFEDFLTVRMEDDEPSTSVIDAYNWLSSNEVFIRDAIRNRRQESQSAFNSSPESNRRQQHAEARQQAEQQRAIEHARASVERAHGNEISNDVVVFGKNKTHLHTDVANRGFQNIGAGTASENKQLWGMPSNIVQETRRSPDWRQQLNEAVAFTDVVTTDTRQVTRSREEKGRFGRTHTTEYTETETIPGSERPKLVRNELTGQEEPVVHFRYQFKFDHAAHSLQGTELPNYKEFQGMRNGQMVAVGLELPKSVADKLKAQVEADPQSVRTLVERLFLDNSDGTMTSTYWNQGGDQKHPVRPPYEQLPVDWNIAIVSGQETVDNGVSNYTIQRVPVSK